MTILLFYCFMYWRKMENGGKWSKIIIFCFGGKWTVEEIVSRFWRKMTTAILNLSSTYWPNRVNGFWRHNRFRLITCLKLVPRQQRV